MEDLVAAYRGKRVLVTGHTGFKGGWLSLWLRELGALVTGFALPPDTTPSLFEAARIAELVTHVEGDVRNLAAVRAAFEKCAPDHVFHLAAQPLVRRSYREPLLTLETNVIGTANVLEAARAKPCRVVIVTSDKCYYNERSKPFAEDDALGGHDLYSASKAAAEIVTAAYRRSFDLDVASARAGNVIGGGDWCEDRLIPDAVRALTRGAPIPVRNPRSTRPWQHVLDPLYGYLVLGGRKDRDAFNFGPEGAHAVQEVIERLLARWDEGRWEDRHDPAAPHEAPALQLATDKARSVLGWQPRWDFDTAISRTAEWYKRYDRGESARDLCLEQIHAFV